MTKPRHCDIDRHIYPIWIILVFWVMASGVLPLLVPSSVIASSRSDRLSDKLRDQIGSKDAVILIDPDGNVLFGENENKRLIPASILKVLTAVFALENLGEDFKFQTRFYKDTAGNLKIQGAGDPLLLSEYIDVICRDMSATITTFNDLILDTGYFEQPLVIPGISDSRQPYDAPNGALCVNFNTVNFMRGNTGKFISAEPQTPLLPFVLKRVLASNLSNGRIMLSSKADECTLYAGHLFLYFLNKHGISGGNTVRMGAVDETKDQLLYTYVSKNALDKTIGMMLEYSNNFMANQLLITTAAEIYGKPGSLKNGIKALRDFAQSSLNISNIRIYEGSGISRKNRVTAASMVKVFDRFEPYHTLMRREGPVYYKTGTLNGIRTRAGYIASEAGRRYKFVILINTPGKTDTAVLKKVIKMVKNRSVKMHQD